MAIAGKALGAAAATAAVAYVVHLELRLQALAQGATACASPPGKATPLPDELELALTPFPAFDHLEAYRAERHPDTMNPFQPVVETIRDHAARLGKVAARVDVAEKVMLDELGRVEARVTTLEGDRASTKTARRAQLADAVGRLEAEAAARVAGLEAR